MTTDSSNSARPVAARREVLAWAIYDWANSAYSTICITIIVAYLLVVLPGRAGFVAYGYAIGISTFISAIVSPTLGAMADAYRNKRTWLTIMALTGSTASVMMGVISPDLPWLIVACFFLANLTYEVGWSVYNGFLPEISDETTVNRVSAWGFGLGYIGGGLLLLIAIMVVQFGDRLGLPTVEPRDGRPEFVDLATDFCATADGQFAVALPNGKYRVAVLMGDAARERRQMELRIMDEQVDVVSTAAGEFYERSYTTQVREGELKIGLRGLDQDHAVLNALGVESEDGEPVAKFDFGVGSTAEDYIAVTQINVFGQRHWRDRNEAEDPQALQFGWQAGKVRARDAVYSLRMRIGISIMGLWWGVFSLPILLILRDRGVPSAEPQPALQAARDALRQVLRTLRNIRKYKVLFIFLIGYLLYNEGVQTVISQASVFAIEVLEMHAGELALVVLMIQFVAMPGTFLIGRLSDWLGQKRTLMLCLAMWVGLLTAAFFVTTSREFWVMAVVLAFVMGGTQSVSRAIMGLMTPPRQSAEFLGFQLCRSGHQHGGAHLVQHRASCHGQRPPGHHQFAGVLLARLAHGNAGRRAAWPPGCTGRQRVVRRLPSTWEVA